MFWPMIPSVSSLVVWISIAGTAVAGGAEPGGGAAAAVASDGVIVPVGGAVRNDPECGPGAGDCFEEHGTPGCNDSACCKLICAMWPNCCFFEWDYYCVELAIDNCAAGACPGTGDCFEPNGTPGCQDAECCQAVCDVDSYCCDVQWDGECVSIALGVCGQGPCPGEGNCFVVSDTPACADETCCSAVCAEDSFCCDVEWDCLCVQDAFGLCGDDACPGAGSCFENNGTPGCDNEFCCNAVCLEDSECCQVGWDNLCVDRAVNLCPSCPGEGGCMVANGTPGCGNANCCDAVCVDMPWCCRQEWDADCAAQARTLCGDSACPGGESCFESHPAPGCDDEVCCNSVCLEDPECCGVSWDNLCVARANDLCVPCPGGGRCDLPGTTPGCENQGCCDAVCAENPSCCDIVWGASCAEAAGELCANSACPGQGSCHASHGSPGCEDEDCCNLVCLRDSFCCQFSWDGDCASEAAEWCGVQNDLLDETIPLSCGEIILGTTNGATADPDTSLCDPSASAPGVWYRLTGTGEPITVHTCSPGTDFDTRIAVFTGDCPRNMACTAHNDNDCGAQSSVTFDSEAGARYLILVYGPAGATGNFELSLNCGTPCPSGPVVWLDPPDGVVDARQPHPVGSLTPLQGIGTIVATAPKGASATCWSLCETPGRGSPNGIASVADHGNGTYTITLDRPITPGAVTTLTYTPDEGSAVTAGLIAHPSNVNGDTGASPLDILKEIDCVNGVQPDVNCPWGLYSCDANHSAECNSADILRVIDLLNGADTFEVWNGTNLPVNDGSCP